MNLSNQGVAFDLARSIWETIKSLNSEQRDEKLSHYYNKLLAGRTSVSWFECEGLGNLKEQIIQKEHVNPFQDKIPYTERDLTTTPVLRSGAELDESTYYLRFLYKDGTRRIMGEDIEVLPTTNTATVYVNEETEMIEVRAKPDEALKIAEVVAGYVRQQITLNKYNFLAPFGSNVDAIADALDQGRLYESKAFPETWIETFSDQENEAIVNILSAIDQYYENEQIDLLQEKLDEASVVLGEELLTSPFIAIILAGMGNVGLKVDESDLRSTVFYRLLSPYLQTSGGYIKFNVEIDNMNKEFSIQVGVDSKSVYFRSNKTTEEVIKEIRDKVIQV
ncbi:hypothetical protein [Halobacillus amylolyticus]|uniref:Uncharacterized protein n=1 Tax=Halobacillus amylolyticus TaxID=2932259 RepID=A0ABY4H7M5_9BACI|nr:hypothetical protein [Halobacillus amylolyticus]UOR10293.1 hypothetical protein MUO15_11240 [Halobacillus amylolyticus]